MASQAIKLQSPNSLNPSASPFSPHSTTSPEQTSTPLEMPSTTDTAMPDVASPFVLSELNAKAFVTLTVGEAQRPFVVLKSLLCLRSEYFRAMFEGNFEETTSRTSSLPDLEPRIFGLILQWFYSGHVLFSNGTDVLPAKLPQTDTFLEALHMYRFADAYDTRDLRKAIFEKVAGVLVLRISMTDQGMEALARALSILPENSGLWKLIADRFLYCWEPKTEEQTAAVLPFLPAILVVKLLILGVGKGSKIDRTNPSPWRVDMCQYHEHLNESERNGCAEQMEAAIAKSTYSLETEKLLGKRKAPDTE